MRQLKLTKPPTDPTWEADRAHALPLLRSLAAAQPLGLPTEDEEKLLQFIVSVATQYRGQGAEWETLLRAGFAGAAHCYTACAEPDQWVSWWVRQKMLKLLPDNQARK